MTIGAVPVGSTGGLVTPPGAVPGYNAYGRDGSTGGLVTPPGAVPVHNAHGQDGSTDHQVRCQLILKNLQKIIAVLYFCLQLQHSFVV